jgi:hypothetical protein
MICAMCGREHGEFTGCTIVVNGPTRIECEGERKGNAEYKASDSKPACEHEWITTPHFGLRCRVCDEAKPIIDFAEPKPAADGAIIDKTTLRLRKMFKLKQDDWIEACQELEKAQARIAQLEKYAGERDAQCAKEIQRAEARVKELEQECARIASENACKQVALERIAKGAPFSVQACQKIAREALAGAKVWRKDDE